MQLEYAGSVGDFRRALRAIRKVAMRGLDQPTAWRLAQQAFAVAMGGPGPSGGTSMRRVA